MDERAAPAPAGGEAFGQHADDRVEILAGQLAEGPGPPHAVVKRCLRPILRRDFGHDLLRKHVERPVRDDQPIKLPTTNAVEQRGAFDQIVARERKQPAFRSTANCMPGASNALQKARDRTRRADLADEIHIADVDAEFERSGGNQGLQLAEFEPLLGGEPVLLRHAAVMSGDGVFAKSVDNS